VKPPMLVGSRLADRRWQVVGLLVVVPLLAVALNGLAAGFGPKPAEALQVYFLAMLASAALTLPALAVVAWLDRREPESFWLYAFAIGWGMFGAGGLAMVLNGALGGAIVDALMGGDAAAAVNGALNGSSAPTPGGTSATGAMLLVAVFIGPPVEEAVKGLAIALLAFFLRGHLQTMRDGIVFGLLVGLGFTLIEAPFYVMKGFIADGQAPWMQQLLARYAFFGLTNHALYSGLVGAGVGLAVQRGRRGRVKPVLGGYLAGTGAHMVNNALAGLALGLFLAAVGAVEAGSMTEATLAHVPPFTYWLAIALTSLILQCWSIGLLLRLVLKSARYERTTIREELTALADTEGDADAVITPAELAALEAESLRGLRVIPGVEAATSRALVTAQNKLALARRQARTEGRDPDSDLVAGAWRAEIRALRVGPAGPTGAV
jgi:protease PrsW